MGLMLVSLHCIQPTVLLQTLHYKCSSIGYSIDCSLYPISLYPVSCIPDHVYLPSYPDMANTWVAYRGTIL